MGTRPPAPIIAEDIERYIDQVAEMAYCVIDSIRADHSLFLQWFGSSDYYMNVMYVYARLAAIREDPESLFKLKIKLVDLSGNPAAQESLKNVDGTYTVVGGKPEVRLYKDRFKTYPSFLDLDLPLGKPDIQQLITMTSTRQILLFHELVHFVGDTNWFHAVIPGGEKFNRFLRGSIVDTMLWPAASGFADDDFVKESLQEFDVKKLEKLMAYGPQTCLTLAQLADGPVHAIHNSDSYTLFALCWNQDKEIKPTYGPVVQKWQNGVGGDPLADRLPPFRNMGRDSDKVFEWWRALGRKLP
ncbi:hypothetical protein HYFRA_00011362 [Hymenoscyphus fraxineus]|uniref:Uncharacterized protein n=1 Tax=Hymenoscyphus fraxineus TaxID=746836 RepID=A0A9N9KZE5_9HELO|nr:hypothetical protein HYFRA_00011362 [Hymenoscyphus fraxineus]